MTRRAVAIAALSGLIAVFLMATVIFSAAIVIRGPVGLANWDYQLGVRDFVYWWGISQGVEWGHIVSSVAFTYPLIFALVVGLPGEARPLTRRAVAMAALGALIAAFLMATVIFSAGIVIRGWNEWSHRTQHVDSFWIPFWIVLRGWDAWFSAYRELIVYHWGPIQGESWWNIVSSSLIIYSSLFVYSFVFIALAVGSPLTARSLIRRLPGTRRRTTLLTVLALVMLVLVMLALVMLAATL